MATKIDIRPAWVAEKPFVTSLLQSEKNQASVKFSTESCVEISMTNITIVGQVDFGPEAIAKMFMKSMFACACVGGGNYGKEPFCLYVRPLELHLKRLSFIEFWEILHGIHQVDSDVDNEKGASIKLNSG